MIHHCGDSKFTIDSRARSLSRVHAFSLSVGCELPGARSERSAWSLDLFDMRPIGSIERICSDLGMERRS